MCAVCVSILVICNRVAGLLLATHMCTASLVRSSRAHKKYYGPLLPTPGFRFYEGDLGLGEAIIFKKKTGVGSWELGFNLGKSQCRLQCSVLVAMLTATSPTQLSWNGARSFYDLFIIIIFLHSCTKGYFFARPFLHKICIKVYVFNYSVQKFPSARLRVLEEGVKHAQLYVKSSFTVLAPVL